VPPYLQVAEIIRSQIRSGKLPTGSRIAEAEITETYEVARSTTRRTLALLRDEALIYTVPSAGATSADAAQHARRSSG
jgi:DNA-binding GntR family transcriptional regulator